MGGMRKIILVCILLVGYFFVALPVFAQECDQANISTMNLSALADLGNKCQEALNNLQNALKPNIDQLNKMNAAIAAFEARIKTVETDVAKKTQEIALGEKELAASLTLAGERIRQFYMRSYTLNPMYLLLSATNIGSALRTIGYQQAAVNEDKKIIVQTALTVKNLEDKKKALEDEKATLAMLKEDTDKRAASVRKLVAEATVYENKLQGVIAAVTAAQQAILNARSGTFTTSLGDVPLADDPNAAPNYNPGFSPAFAGFSFGAYTHKKGMSQYGAKGRAEKGQDANQILQAYYGKTPVNKDTGGDISVSGIGNMNFEDRYLLGIAEMPASFPKEALRAQAVAARSYAYRYKTQGQTICTTQSCQVFSSSKADNPPGEWREAVQGTRGQVIEDVVAYYSSTTGGYLLTMGWDTTCGGQGCWTSGAYESIAGSPWFYKGWYTSDYYNNSAKCNRSHPWLTQEEFTDILNAWFVRKNGTSDDNARILPVTINSCSISGASGNPYQMDELRARANALGGAFTSVSSISVTYNSGGFTDSVTFGTNKGSVTIPGGEFKDSFNLRAPGYISIRSSLYNIEKK